MPNRIDAVLGELRESGRTALAPYITIGFPDVPTSEELVRTILDSGGDMLELGVPFSDPLADGPTIQMTTYRALQNGVTVRECLAVVRRLRASGVEAPLVFLGYYNPYFRYGAESFLDDAADAGVDGMIVPDLPTVEAAQFGEMCRNRGIHLVPMLAPTSSDERISDACKAAGGFIYCVSLTGVTSARRTLSRATAGLVERIRQHTDLPILVGFGVSRPEHLVEIGTYAEGAAVGSALLDAVDRASPDGKLEAARDFIHSLRGIDGKGDN